jgi:Glucodextranase, domain B
MIQSTKTKACTVVLAVIVVASLSLIVSHAQSVELVNSFFGPLPIKAFWKANSSTGISPASRISRGRAITQSAAPSDFYLHGTDPIANPASLFLDNTAPTTTTAKSKDSSSINFNGGNPWKEVGTWNASPSLTRGVLTSLSGLHVWVGLKNSDDQGTNFDVRAEVYKNNTLISAGLSQCVTGVTRNAANAKEVVVPFASVPETLFDGAVDTLFVKVLTRIGTDATGARCGGHSNAVGLLSYFDATNRPSKLGATIIVDSTPPTITATVTPTANATGWHHTNPTVTFTCADEFSGIASCTAPITVSTETAGQVVVGTAIDRAGNVATTTVTVKLDKTAPSLSLNSPENGSTVFASPAAVGGTLQDALSGFASATCNGVTVTVNGESFNCDVPLSPGPNAINASATDVAGNTATSALSLIYSRIPRITLTSPANLSYLNISPTTVTGTVDDPTATVNINSIQAVVENGAFSVALPLAEGPNIVTASASSASGGVETASIEVTLDTTPPHVTITSPPEGFVTTSDSITVAGNINDIVVGTVNDEQAHVTVNGATAEVANRMFLATNVPLNLGNNLIQAVGRDRVGNAATTQITVIRRTSTQPQIRLISGNNQTATMGSAVPAPLVVVLTDSDGNPVPSKPVIFRVTQDNGMVTTNGTPAASAIAVTNVQGQAQAHWTLGMRAGAGANSVDAYAVGFEGTAIFTATGTLGPAGKIVIDTGNNQIAEVNQPLPKPLIAVVVDTGNNRLGGVPVTFRVKEGGGSFGGQPTFTVNTDSDGRAAATLTLGPEEGNANNLVAADFPSNQAFPSSFTASGRAPGDPSRTTISGVVLDNSNVPISGVTIRAVLTNLIHSNSSIIQSVAAVQTDEQGQFTIAQAPVGFVKLLVDGSTAQRTGTYPTLDYDIVTVAGINNTLAMPIFLLPLNTDNQLCVTATTGGGTLTIPEAPGFSLTFGPGQVTFPGGSKTGCVSVTVVHGDKVPMVPGFGQQPRFIVTIQPAGALFNPPARITLPNVDGLPPRAVTEMYSFDHDIGSFVAIGTGTVSDDGQVIRSNPGVGVLKAGWHCGGDPNANGSVADCPDCKICQGDNCVTDPAQEGRTCKTQSGAAGVCKNGVCTPSVKIEASFINHDDPRNNSYETLPKGDPVYGGSEESTSDKLKLMAVLEPGAPSPNSYTWSVTGPGSGNYTPPPPSASASEWDVGKVGAPPGTLTFKVVVDFGDGTQAQDTRDVELGVRTDDTIVVGWINPNGVAIPGGASAAVTGLLTSPPPVPSPLQCNLFILDLSENFTTPNFISLTPIDRSYVLNWMFKFGSNVDPVTIIPGGDFRDPASAATDENKVSNFINTATNFKLYNRFQIKFRVGPGGTFQGGPTILHQDTRIGTTKNPCGSLVFGIIGTFAGQAGPNNGPPPATPAGNSRMSLINDGSPDSGAIRAFNTLTGKDLPPGTTAVFWEDIGTRISFSVGSGSMPTVVLQPYPTYYEFHNGTLVSTRPQAASPLGNFATNPYPFGTVSCLGLGGITPGGRCGYATGAAEPSARVPTFTVP